MDAILAIFTPLPGCRFSDVRAEIYFAADCPDSTPEECAREDARRYGASVEIVPASALAYFCPIAGEPLSTL